MGEDSEVYQKRDLILQEISDRTKYLVERADKSDEALKIHLVDDKDFQKEINSKMSWGIKIAVIVLVIVAANGGMTAIKVLFHIG